MSPPVARRPLSTSSTAEALEAIRAEEDPERRALLVNRFLSARRPLCVSIARRAAGKRPGLSWSRDGDDLTAIAMSVAAELVQRSTTGKAGDPPWRWEAMLTTRANSAIREWAESSALSGVSGMTGAMRRRRSIVTTWERLAADTGRTPTTAEVLAAQRGDALGRSNPGKQGALATAQDVAEIDAAFVTHLQAAESIADFQDPLADIELEDTIRSIVTQCAEVDDMLGAFADVWLHRVVSDPDPLSVVARDVGVGPALARRLVVQVREVAAGVLSRAG